MLVTSPDPGTLTLRVAEIRLYGASTVNASLFVRAGYTYEISVALHDPAGGGSSQKFELITSLEPLPDDH